MANYTHAKLVKLKDCPLGGLTEGKVYPLVPRSLSEESFSLDDDEGYERFMWREGDDEADFELLTLPELESPKP